MHLICVGNWHDAGNDGNGDSRFAYLVKEIVKQVVVKKHLCGQKIRTGVYFFPEIPDVFLLIGAFRVDLRIAGCTDAEVGVCGFQLVNKVNGVPVVPAAAVRALKCRRNVASQRHYICYSGGFYLIYLLTHRFFCGGNTGKVR